MANILKSDLFYSLTGGFLVGALALAVLQPVEGNANEAEYTRSAVTEIGAGKEG